MKDPSRTNQELLEEISALKDRIQELERSETEHTQTEEGLRFSRQQLQLLIDSGPDFFFLKDLDLRYQLVNDANARFFGRDKADILSRTDMELMPEGAALACQESDRLAIREKRLVIAVEPLGGKVYETYKFPVIVGDEAVGVAGIIRDITERKRTEEELRAVRGRYRLLFEHAPDGVVIVEPATARFVEFNEAAHRQLGYSREEFAGLSISDIEVIESPEETLKHIENIIHKGRDDFETMHRTRQGEIRNIHVTAQVTEISGRRVYHCVWRDITARKRAEEALRESEAFNRRLFESNRTAIVVMDAETTRYIDCNPAAVAIYRYQSRDDIIGKTPLDVSADIQYDGTPSPEKAMYYIREARDRGFMSFEWLHRRPDGQYWDALVHLMSFESRGHQLIQFSLYDITEQKKTEEALKQAEAKYRAIFENAAMGIYQTTPEGRYIAVNPAFARIYGYESPQEMLETVTDIGGQTYVNPEDRVRLMALLRKQGVVEQFVTQFFRKDKSTGWVSISAHAIKDAEDNITYFEGTIEDITARKGAEKALQESEEKYRGVVESSFIAFYIIQDQAFRFANRGFLEITGYSYDEVIDKLNPLDIVHPDDKKVAELNMEKRITGEIKSLEFAIRLVRKDGQLRYVKIFGTSLVCNGRRAAAGTIIDVTREKELEQQLLQTQKLEAVGTLAGGIAHDFNNILAGIMGFAEMVRDDTAPDSREYHRLGLILKGAHRGRDLVRQILTFSRQAQHEQKPMALSGIVEEGLKLLRPLLPSTIEIRSKGLTGDDTILADSAQIHQVLMNLCTNGAQAMGKKGGVLEISVAGDHFKRSMPSSGMKPGDYVTLTVHDTGSGMKPEILERIFDPFFTTKPHAEGTGLGLSVVHGIVKSHGGFIQVESEPGKGSVFHIHLPKIERQEGAPVREELPVKGGKECILFVDDEDILVELNNERLTQLGYAVVATTSSLEALKLFKKEPLKFDLVITDYTMPDMTGVDFARKLLKVRSDIPIILCTGYNDDISPDRAKKAGIKEFLLKPQGKRELDLTIRRVLDIRD